MDERLHDAWRSARDAFLDYEGVLGVGRGPKERAGGVVAPAAIVVLVERKLGPSEVPDGQLVPDEVAGIPTDVRTPRVMVDPDAPRHPDGRPRGQWCATDLQWLDWAKIDRLARERGGAAGA